jgi:TRAP-type mannitol/chloroaromatic compound transport system permease large subunit
MATLGLVLLLGVLLANLTSGLPAYALLLCASVIGALVGVGLGDLTFAQLGALPARLVGLFEHDLLQAVPLFALTGALLEHLGLAGLFYRGLCALTPGGRLPAGDPAADRNTAVATMRRAGALLSAAALAPMTGSVGASVATLARSIAPALARRGVTGHERIALVAAASTLGVLLPPSLVLLLLADALMRAHTEAIHAGASAARIVNSQDLLRGALLPAAMLLASWLLVSL